MVLRLMMCTLKINLVRQRVGMPVVDQTKYGTKDKLRELIPSRALREFAGEGLRRLTSFAGRGTDGKMIAETVLIGPLQRMVGTVDMMGKNPGDARCYDQSLLLQLKLSCENRIFKPHFPTSPSLSGSSSTVSQLR